MSGDTPQLSLGSVTCDLLAVRQPHTPPLHEDVSTVAPSKARAYVRYFLHTGDLSQHRELYVVDISNYECTPAMCALSVCVRQGG